MKHLDLASVGAKASAMALFAALLLQASSLDVFAAQQRIVVSGNLTRSEAALQKTAQMKVAAGWSAGTGSATAADSGTSGSGASGQASTGAAASTGTQQDSSALQVVGVPVSQVTQVQPAADKHLTKRAGVFWGPSGKETWYDLDMTKTVAAMRKLGFSEEKYPYWVRADGVKMLGQFVMVAACYDVHPKGWAVETSLGTGIVVDTGGFAKTDPYLVDIAVSWKTQAQ